MGHDAAERSDEQGAEPSIGHDRGVRLVDMGAQVEPAEAGTVSSTTDALLDRLGLIEAQPLEDRARGFEQLHDELVAELQRSDHERA